MVIVLRALVAALACVFFWTFRGVFPRAVVAVTDAPRSAFSALEENAKQSISSPPDVIRSVLGRLTTYSGFSLSTDLKERLLLGELAFRSGAKPGVPPLNIALTLNEVAKLANGPEYLYTNETQVRDFVDLVMHDVPNLLYPRYPREEKEFSPYGAIFLIAMLLRTKISAPGGRAAPDDWAKILRMRQDEFVRSRNKVRPGKYVLSGRCAPEDEIIACRRVGMVLGDPKNAAILLDKLLR